MAGVTDTVFRRLIRNQGGCGLLMTEFTSSHGVVSTRHAKKPNRNFRYLYFEPEEHPITCQLFGSDPDVMAEAAKVCEERGFDIVDINFGCPVNKVVKCNGGSGLLRDLPLVETILRKVRSAISIPLTCKFRAGWNDQRTGARADGENRRRLRLVAVALHPRTREQGYSGRADWSRIAEVKAAVKIPGDRKRRCHHARRCRAHASRDRLRCRHDRPHSFLQSLDFPPDRGVSANRLLHCAARARALRHDEDLLPDAAGARRSRMRSAR